MTNTIEPTNEDGPFTNIKDHEHTWRPFYQQTSPDHRTGYYCEGCDAFHSHERTKVC